MDVPRASPGRKLDEDRTGAFERLFETFDFWLYLAFSLTCVAYAAHTFYGYMRVQTGGIWSAPLDDVFIHFDYARSTARGYPFEWSEGNGFSSGNTSLSYPFVLAFGYWIGFRDLYLMKWAAIVACASITVFLVLGARVTAPFGRFAKYLLPPVTLCIGALDWSLFSGMENAFHLCTWALLCAASFRVACVPQSGSGLTGRALLAGLASALLYFTRPESVVCIAAFSIWAAALLYVRRIGTASAGETRTSRRLRVPLRVLLLMSVPGVIALFAQAIANRALTGEWAAAGAITKLALNHPYMTGADKWAQYKDLLRYVVLRNTHHHFADFDATHKIPWGWLVPIVALLPFVASSAARPSRVEAPTSEEAEANFSKNEADYVPSVRGIAALLWAQVIGWLALVSLNGQVRWQNERYTMPAVAWLLMLAAMGLATLIGGAWRRGGRPALPERAHMLFAGLRGASALAIALIFWRAQLPRMNDQIWFFGRASRNILDQHVVAGRVLGRLDAKRILVGDAGALIYSSDRPGMDLIGLGGYHDLPFARANTHGLGASLELIERVADEDRPDYMALYPGWWGDLPLLFGKRLTGIPVFGNVICGGSEKVIYRADWSPMDRDGIPRAIQKGEGIVDEIDVADLVSEKRHAYVFPHPAAGFVVFRLLADQADPDDDLFDAGRVIAPGQRETMRVSLPRGPARLVMRTSPELKAKIDVLIDGVHAGQMVLSGLPASAGRSPSVRQGGRWVEVSFDLPSGAPPSAKLDLLAVEGAFVDYHLWIVAPLAGDTPR